MVDKPEGLFDSSRATNVDRICFLFTMSDNPQAHLSTRETLYGRCIRRVGRLRRDPASGGARRDRTDDLMLAKHALSQLSYGPVSLLERNQPELGVEVVGLGRFELPTSRLSSARSNQLSYRPLSVHPYEERETKTAVSRVCSERHDLVVGVYIQVERKSSTIETVK